MIQAAEAHFWKSFNSSFANFGHSYSVVKTKIFKQYCYSCYGSPLWSVYGNNWSRLCIAWRKALKIYILNLLYGTHKRILARLCGSAPLHIQLKEWFFKFICKALNPDNSVINSVTTYACNNPMSVCSGDWSETCVCEGSCNRECKRDFY